MWRDLGSKNPNIFTLEASFCGPKFVKYEPNRKRTPFTNELNYHFNTEDLMNVGKNLCQTLLAYEEAKTSGAMMNIEYQIEQF